jgi:hypothetical protein
LHKEAKEVEEAEKVEVKAAAKAIVEVEEEGIIKITLLNYLYC